MNDIKSLSHSKWRCKYHIVFAPKYCRQVIYKKIRIDIRKILRVMRKKKSRNNRSRMLPKSYPYLSGNTTAFECSRIYGVFEK